MIIDIWIDNLYLGKNAQRKMDKVMNRQMDRQADLWNGSLFEIGRLSINQKYKKMKKRTNGQKEIKNYMIVNYRIVLQTAFLGYCNLSPECQKGRANKTGINLMI